MKWLIVNSDYPDFLRWLYAKDPRLEQQPYEEQMRARNESLFGVADFYSSNLSRLGHEVWDIHANNEFMQRAWAREHGIRLEEPGGWQLVWRRALQSGRRMAARRPIRYFKPVLRRVMPSFGSRQTWFYEVLAAQIKHYKPDILLNQAMDGVGSRFLIEMKPCVRLLVGQIASPLPQNEDFRTYDLVISSLPNFVDYFRSLGMQSELHRFAFEPSVLRRLKSARPEVSVSFVGSVSPVHQTRVLLLEDLCSRLEIKVWGQGIDRLPQNSTIRSRYVETAWGIEMYQILQASKMTLNHHIGIAESYANNMRLYEATGVGTLLITDWKVNLHEIFEPGREVVAYRSPEECAEVIEYYLGHSEEREAIARAGQLRTLGEHTYYQRVPEVVGIVARHVSHRSAAGH